MQAIELLILVPISIIFLVTVYLLGKYVYSPNRKRGGVYS
jgi:hypothetical protein